MKIQKLELKSIKHFAALSQETHAYSANIYVNGKRVGVVSNEGSGHCDSVFLDKGTVITIEQINQYCKSEYIDDCDFEYWCCEQVNRFIAKKDLKKELKRKILLIQNCRIYGYRLKPTQVNIDAIKKRDNIEITLNEMDFEVAFENYIKYA